MHGWPPSRCHGPTTIAPDGMLGMAMASAIKLYSDLITVSTDCKVNPHSPGRTRCDECHRIHTNVTAGTNDERTLGLIELVLRDTPERKTSPEVRGRKDHCRKVVASAAELRAPPMDRATVDARDKD